MKPEQDAYGQELWNHYRGKETFEVIERIDGFVGVSAGPGAYFSTYDEWPEHYKKALSLVKGRVLDIGCGAGRICLYLQEQGHSVVGIDNSPKAIDVCQLRGVKDARVCSITQVGADLGIFDTLVMLGNNFGLLGSFKRARWLLRRFRKLTSPGALIIAESNDPYQTESADHLDYHAYNRQRGRMGGQVRLRVRHRKYIGAWMDYLMVSKEEMQSIITGTGWQIRDYLDGEGSMYIAVIAKED